jgi:hypothetical protein
LCAAAEPPPSRKPVPAAHVSVTAELACLHCSFGIGDGCAVALKLDDKTPLVLAGPAAKKFEEQRLEKKVLVVRGTLTLGKDKQLTLTSDDARLFTEKDKAIAPAKTQVRVEGVPCCGQCDLKVCDDCTLAIVNARHPIILDGKLALQHAEEAKAITATGRLFLDKRGLLRLDATKVDLVKKK